MTENSSEVVKKQQLVHLNVGGVPFTILRETLGKYNKSTVTRMVEDHTDLVKSGEYLFVDRDPKTFPWILEIYRDGNFRGCVPDMSSEALEKELKFYKLPNLSRLGIEVARRKEPPPMLVSPMAQLFREIVAEIYSCGMIDFLPVEILVYNEYKDGKLEGGGRKILIVPPGDLDAKYVTDRGHRTFVSALSEGSKSAQQTNASYKRLIPQNAKTEFWVVDFRDKVKLQLLNREAQKYDMECNCHDNTYGNTNERLTLNVLCVYYQVGGNLANLRPKSLGST